MSLSFGGPLDNALVAYYGVFELAHVILNVSFFLGVVSLADVPPPPPGGWEPTAGAILTGTALTDLLIAVLAFVFVVGYFRRQTWMPWAGLVALTTYAHNHVIFSYYTVASGAWTGHVAEYVLINLLSVPLLVLFARLSFWISRSAPPRMHPRPSHDRRLLR